MLLSFVNWPQYPSTTDPTQHARYAGTPGLMATSANGLSDVGWRRSPISHAVADWEAACECPVDRDDDLYIIPCSCNEGV